ncbi:hypothetical protein PInf_023398 [Phytophthora infestans]|nr:hypothetical protein PInf_023398 [Phytophthora infestans]
MPSTTSSDSETVLGDEDSLLSPCIWIHSATMEDRRQPLMQQTVEISNEACSGQGSAQGSDTSFCLQNTRRELRLSPTSQLNVLSQISELADAQSKQHDARSAASRPIRHAQRTHMWSPIMAVGKGKKRTRTAVSTTKMKAKKMKTTQKKPSRSQAERLAEDMQGWETCSEGEWLAVDTDEEVDQWVFDAISDSDFEA